MTIMTKIRSRCSSDAVHQKRQTRRYAHGLGAILLLLAGVANAVDDKPNILVIWGDDIGVYNVSAYHRGLLGGSTPNIDRIANEGALFTDSYSEQSCTAGRSAFITGQHPFRTGLLKVGMPGSTVGLSDKDPTIATVLKSKGYATGQFGKNHLGDRDEFLPTAHGFDEFFGNLYHLNAEEEPETYFYPNDPAFREKYAPRGVIHSWADGRIDDTGPLTRKRMETVDKEFTDATIEFMRKSHADGKPFFVWYNSTRMHIWTHLSPEWEGKSGYGLYADGMAEHDHYVGKLLDTLDELGVADNTIVIYSTDNGAQSFTYPDGGAEPFRGAKGSTWEGGFRVPLMVKWPGLVKPGTVINDIFSNMDWFPTLARAVGVEDVAGQLKQGMPINDKTYKVYLDGYDQTELLAGTGPGKRETIFYFDDNANINALRWRDWKLHFASPESWGSLEARAEYTFPRMVHLRSDPFEESLEASGYARFMADQLWLFIPMQQVVGEWLGTFREFPPRQPTPTFSINQVIEKMNRALQQRKPPEQG